jgi:hypothetical protein
MHIGCTGLVCADAAIGARRHASLVATQHRAMRSDSANSAYDYVAPNADTIVDDGKVIGADPDPSVRTQLPREGDHTEFNSGN